MIYPPLRVISVSGHAFSYGVESRVIQGVSVNIYNTAKTIADCFKLQFTGWHDSICCVTKADADTDSADA